MSTRLLREPRIKDFRVSDDTLTAVLTDGRTVSVPLAWSWRLSEADPAERQQCEIIGDGVGVRWPALDEDLSAQGMLTGVPAYRSRSPKGALAS